MNAKRLNAKRRNKSTKDREVLDILERSYPSHREPLQTAWSWSRDPNRTKQEKAFELLTGLKDKYPHVLKVRFELALALVKRGNQDQALHELKLLGEEFPILDEDTLCLWGRCYKDAGDDALKENNYSVAADNYWDAIVKYRQAYSLPEKNRFAGINVATLRLVLASVLNCQTDPQHTDESLREKVNEQRESSRKIAKELLECHTSWERVLRDDDIWIIATEAEARLLLGEWQQAAKRYGDACSESGVMPFHRDSMKKQVKRIVESYSRLNVRVGAEFAKNNITAMFRNPPAKSRKK